MLLGCNNYNKCSFNVFPRAEGGVSNSGRFGRVFKSQSGKFDLSPRVGPFGRRNLGSPQRPGT